MTDKKCVVCNYSCKTKTTYNNNRIVYECPRCRKFEADQKAILTSFRELEDNERSLLSHEVAKYNHETNKALTLTTYNIPEILLKKAMLNPFEQGDNFIMYLAEWANKNGYGKDLNLTKLGQNIYGVIGLKINDTEENEFRYVCKELDKKGLIKIDGGAERQLSYNDFRLTFDGWKRYEEIRTKSTSSKTIFFASQFVEANDPLHILVNQHLKPEVVKTGFILDNPLQSSPQMGLIDVHMELAIRNCRMLIADLSHDNRGAYWEAGFAFGLGKPVLYICNEDSKGAVHFDTSHFQTVFWKTGEEKSVGEKIKSIIRTTLGAEAIQEDPLIN